MTAASASTIEYDYALISPGLSRLEDGDVVSLEPLLGGRNARVYRLDCAGGETYCAKIYPEGAAGSGGSRRGREYAALQFMWRGGIREIPEPIHTDPDAGYTVLRYVEGFPFAVEGVVDADVDFLTDFLVRLDGLKHEPASRALGEASEACHSLEQTFDWLRARIGRLRAVAEPQGSRIHAELSRFIEDAFAPAFERIAACAQDQYAERGACAEERLDEARATLSPSDFGFHNARRAVDGSIVLLDFEHFGWDDPAKLVSDFLLHPGFALSDALRGRFFQGMVERHPCGAEIAWRVPIVLPLHALKWSTILLNEFVAEHRERRGHARPLLGPDEGRLERQLERARRMLETALTTSLRFPFAPIATPTPTPARS